MKMVFRLLLTASFVTFILTSNRYHVNGSSEVKAIKTVESILNDLDYIEHAEESQRSDGVGPDLDTTEARAATCKAMLNMKPEIDGEASFQLLVSANLELWNKCSATWNSLAAIAEWNFDTNINDETESKLNTVLVEVSGYFQKLSKLAKEFVDAPWYGSLDDSKQRQLRFMAMDDSPKHQEDKQNLLAIQSKLQNIYSNAEVDGKAMEPHLTKLMASSRNAEELVKYWVGWRDVTGKLMKDDYADFVGYLNTGATDNGYADYGQSWLEGQFDDVVDIRELSETLWKEVEPLYQQLHAYVRMKLKQKYPMYIDIYGPGGIPAHLTGNMWAQVWSNIYSLVKPFPEIEEPNYDTALEEQNYTVEDLFGLAEDFYTSIGLFNMTSKFDEFSMKERPSDRSVVCHASASDFYGQDDYRIKMCTEVNTEYLGTIHHEMGHIEYFMAYKDQPTVFRNGANSGFHEAIGDTISLSVMTPKHMQKIGLADKSSPSYVTKSNDGLSDDKKREINTLLKVALSKIAFLPFGYMIDKWRWDVFDGTVNKDEYNKHWWDLRLKYQGIVSPVPRSEDDFDPGAKFHIPSNSPYICYFISFILQFQFYETMCQASGELDDSQPLHACDFYGSKEAGTLLKNMMALGESKPWNVTLREMTGQSEIKTDSILRYFEPLNKWLQKVNRETDNDIGWVNAQINWVDDQSETKSRNSETLGGKKKTAVEETDTKFHKRHNLLNLSKPSATAQRKKSSRPVKQTAAEAILIDLIRKIIDSESDED